MTRYYSIQNTDGETMIHVYDKHEIEEVLQETGEECLEFIPDHDTNYWGGKRVIIKGEVVVPKPVKVVTQFEVP